MPKQTLVFDLDGVLCDLLTPWLATYNGDYWDNLKPEDIKEWDLHKFVLPQCGRKIYHYLRGGDLYLQAKPIPGAVEAIPLIQEHYDVFVATATTSCAGTIAEKQRWLGRYFPTIPTSNYAFIKRKELLSAYGLVDDYPVNLEGFLGRKFLMRAPYNADHKGRFVRVSGFEDLIFKLDIRSNYLHGQSDDRSKEY